MHSEDSGRAGGGVNGQEQAGENGVEVPEQMAGGHGGPMDAGLRLKILIFFCWLFST